MIAETLRQPAVKERVVQLGYLLKHTFALVGRDPGILRPWVRMSVYGVVMASLFFISVIALWVNNGNIGTPALLLCLGMFVYKYFYYVRQELRQSWLVSEVLKGEKRSAAEAKARVKTLKGKARGIALIDIFFSGMLSWALRFGPVGALMSLLLRGLREVWDLVNHYLLPSVVIDGHGIRESVSRMKRLKESVPETLVGVFGIDVAARAVGTIMFPVYALMVFVGLLIGAWVGDPQSAYYVGDPLAGTTLAGAGPLPETLPITVLPILIALWLAKLFSVVLERTAASVKVIYFSIFYMRITHADDIVPEIRGELEAYLRMEAEDPGPVAAPDGQQGQQGLGK
ncbi:hypothetical protein HOP52_07840 [Halomonas campisalis]|uniref:Uncharacterized protein n=1 Tax=Billgrantia campisalis TaxID=74661 RepID=A0ABS9P8X2_9GAMM|nr:hypothetical protein [Halomonas campisalis]MCG6657667.1 hypothetical protein [Halomonas campisalis]MDR5862561.1 hypothetical protein [Halomonas campisalis]